MHEKKSLLAEFMATVSYFGQCLVDRRGKGFGSEEGTVFCVFYVHCHRGLGICCNWGEIALGVKCSCVDSTLLLFLACSVMASHRRRPIILPRSLFRRFPSTTTFERSMSLSLNTWGSSTFEGCWVGRWGRVRHISG